MVKKSIFILLVVYLISVMGSSLNAETIKNSTSSQTLADKDYDISKEVKALNDKIKRAENQYNKQEDMCKKRLVVMYKTSNIPRIEMFLRAENVFEFYKKTYIMSMVEKKDKQMLRDLDLAKKELESSKKMKEDLEKGLVNDNTKEKDIDKVIEPSGTVKSEIANRKRVLDYYKSSLDVMEKSSREIDDYIRGINAGEVPPSNITTWPVPTCHSISSPFGYRINPVYGYSELHDGIDIPAPYGTSVVAAGNGRVEQAGWYGGFGYTVIINHGAGIFTLYGHNSSLAVNKGDMVSAGRVIANVGSTGISTGAHLHFTVKKNGVSVDPLGYIKP